MKNLGILLSGRGSNFKDLAIDIAQPAHAFAALAPLRELADLSGAYPRLAQWAAAPSGPTPREQLELGLRLLLDGMPKRRARK